VLVLEYCVRNTIRIAKTLLIGCISPSETGLYSRFTSADIGGQQPNSPLVFDFYVGLAKPKAVFPFVFSSSYMKFGNSYSPILHLPTAWGSKLAVFLQSLSSATLAPVQPWT